MRDFVTNLDDDWFLYKYEAMVDQEFADLNTYLGFDVKTEAEVPKGTGK